ncbi:MAG: SIMPL domain-containing protein [Acidimicrobiales bacterium]
MPTASTTAAERPRRQDEGDRRRPGPGSNRARRRRAGAVSVLVAAVLAGGVVVSACASTGDPPPVAAPACGTGSPRLTVEGTGLATGTPNILTVTVGIDVTDPTATGAMTDDNEKATSVADVLGLSGSASRDVQTSDLSMNPQYNAKGAITGYQVTNTLTATLRNFSTAGSVIDAMAGAAGNATRLEGLTFAVEDTRGLEDRARTDAVGQAVSHARSMALAAGERLGPVCSLSDQTQSNVYSPAFGAQSLNDDAGSAAATVPLQPGSQQETAQVTMVYSLLPPALRR